MNQTMSCYLYGQTMELPSITKNYSTIRQTAIVRAKAVIQKLETLMHESLHLVAAFHKICSERPLLIQQEIDYYIAQIKLLHNDVDIRAWQTDALQATHTIVAFEETIQQQFEQAKVMHNLKAINEHIFTAATFKQYFQTTYDALLQLHVIYLQYVAQLSDDDSYAPHNLPFQTWQEAHQIVQTLKEQPSKEKVVSLLLADPYEPMHIAIAYALFGDPQQELTHFLAAIDYREAQSLLKGCAQAAALFGAQNQTIHFDNYDNPLFSALLQQQALSSFADIGAYVISQCSERARPYVYQQPLENVLFAYKGRKQPVLALTPTALIGKGKWFKTIHIPYENIYTKHIQEGLCTINGTLLNLPQFERTDDVLLQQFIDLLSVVAKRPAVLS